MVTRAVLTPMVVLTADVGRFPGTAHLEEGKGNDKSLSQLPPVIRSTLVSHVCCVATVPETVTKWAC